MTRGSGILVVAALILLAASAYFRPEAKADVPGASKATGGDLITVQTDLPDGRQQITVISPSQHVMSVYHIDATTGGISLKSVRNIRWDMLLDEFNGTHPSPREIHALLNR